MTFSFTIRLLMFVALFVGVIIGILTQQIGLLIPYLCLAPWIGLWFGRATVGVFANSRFTRISPKEQELLSRYRRQGS
jgi:ascorbate-specific PTS system EIIC-type component UlaA